MQADLLLANTSTLGLRGRPELHLSVLSCFADSLFEDLQYRRALVQGGAGEEREGGEERECNELGYPSLSDSERVLFCTYFLLHCFPPALLQGVPESLI